MRTLGRQDLLPGAAAVLSSLQLCIVARFSKANLVGDPEKKAKLSKAKEKDATCCGD